jgi:hypothetical protein
VAPIDPETPPATDSGSSSADAEAPPPETPPADAGPPSPEDATPRPDAEATQRATGT